MINKMTMEDIREGADELARKLKERGAPSHMIELMIMTYIGGNVILHDATPEDSVLTETLKKLKSI